LSSRSRSKSVLFAERTLREALERPGLSRLASFATVGWRESF
jgi:hypothetical protein